MPDDADDPELAKLRDKKLKRYRRVHALHDGGTQWPNEPVTVDTAKAVAAIKQYPVTALEFWAEWCRPCIQLQPIIHELAQEYWGDVAFLRLNLDENPDARERWGVTALPTIILAKHAREVARLQGVLSRRRLQEELAPYAAEPEERLRRVGRLDPPGP
jgi:thioredoxin 1